MNSQQAFDRVNEILKNTDIKHKEAQEILDILQAFNNELVKAQKGEEDADI